MTDFTPDTVAKLRSRCDNVEAMGHPHIMLDVRTTHAMLDRAEAATTDREAPEEQDDGRTPDQSWIVALHNLRICADELHRIGHGGEARMIEDAVNRIVAFRQHIAVRARAEVVEQIIDKICQKDGATAGFVNPHVIDEDIRALATTEQSKGEGKGSGQLSPDGGTVAEAAGRSPR